MVVNYEGSIQVLLYSGGEPRGVESGAERTLGVMELVETVTVVGTGVTEVGVEVEVEV